MKPWIYQGKPVEEIPENVVGFVYNITNDKTGQSYIGKKFCWSRRRKKVAGRKNRKVVVKESNWKEYFGSSEFLIADAEEIGYDKFSREILNWYYMKKDVSFGELEEQIKRNVLTARLPNGDFLYYNRSILGKYFRSTKT
jgi:hypothetical protein